MNQISIDELQALILTAAAIVSKFNELDSLRNEIPFEDEIIQFICCFQKMQDGYSTPDWDEFDRWLKSQPTIQPEDFS
jgi:hypothetical protein